MHGEVERLALRYGIRAGLRENVGEAATRLGTTPRMLRYAEQLGLLAPARSGGNYRVYGERDLLAAAYGGELADSYRVTPAALGFALRALAEPEVAARLRTLARLAGRAGPERDGEPARSAALDFETSKAQRLLRLAS
jgi:MerR family transcriptional regulator, copper efflux regulator